MTDPDDELECLVDLSSAATVDEVHRILVLYPHLRGSTTAVDPVALLRTFHEVDPASTVVTAMLMLTDQRWRAGVGDLARRIAESGLLDTDTLDLLARTFVAAGDAVFWQVPDEWFSADGIVIDVPGVDQEIDDDEIDEDEPDRPAVARREVVPRVRRWATTWVVRRDLSAWGPLLARARELGTGGGAGVMAGLLDVVDDLPPAARELLVNTGVGWPDRTVRRTALGMVAERDGAEAAYALGRRDKDALVRAWAESLLNPRPDDRPSTLF